MTRKGRASKSGKHCIEVPVTRMHVKKGVSRHQDAKV
jgi:hypothetical protein